MSAPAELVLDRRPPFREAGLWLGAGIVVLAAHAAFAYLLHDISPMPERDAMEKAMEIDLAPLLVSVPEAVQSETMAQEEPAEEVEPVEEAEVMQPEQDQAVEELPEAAPEVEQVAEAESDPETLQPEVEQPVAEEIPPEPETILPEPEETQTAEAETEEPQIVEEETVAAVTPEVAIPLPQPRPEQQVEEKPEPPKKKPVRKRVEVAKDEAPKEKTKKATRPPKWAPPASQASAASSAPDIDPSRWNSAVRAAIARRASAVRGMSGTVRVSFVVNASGSIVAASVSGSSGNPNLDRAALGMVRAARVPAPPAGLDGSRHAFAIPLTFR